MPRLLLERGIRLYLRVGGRCGKVKDKNGVIGICRAGLETLRAQQTESLLAASQRDVTASLRKTLRGVFLLGRVKSGKTLGNGCSSTKSLLGS